MMYPMVSGELSSEGAQNRGSDPAPPELPQISATLVIRQVWVPATFPARSSDALSWATEVIAADATEVIMEEATDVIIDEATEVIIDEATLVIIDEATLVIMDDATEVIIAVASPENISAREQFSSTTSRRSAVFETILTSRFQRFDRSTLTAQI
ncbi:hypothetical protein D1012_17185 [Pseudotabrizicola alkalilacus]|uniref:Uncharacterized protein n=1 Tax=Pseudotabrizicola alkalilacus TaxID=2305252 RepID=A0A411YZ94_9RHOB|nr:hypothetical protein D1012_17185 [Pseudotabrizicola alkalilacus]